MVVPCEFIRPVFVNRLYSTSKSAPKFSVVVPKVIVCPGFQTNNCFCWKLNYNEMHSSYRTRLKDTGECRGLVPPLLFRDISLNRAKPFVSLGVDPKILTSWFLKYENCFEKLRSLTFYTVGAWTSK